MCGICGIYHPTQPVDTALLGAMTDSLRHRGPDGDGYYEARLVSLGMRRLAIIDVEGSDQPIHNEDKRLTLIFNGEIYNYRELRADLLARGHALATQGDGETIVHLYEEHGVDCVKHLNGIFAFALWDEHSATLLLARDHLGIKPLHYAPLPDGTLLFGSEIKSLLRHQALPRDLDPAAVEQYFALRYIPSPRSIYRAVRKLPPAHRLVARAGEFRVEPYWDWRTRSDASRSPSQFRDALRALFEDTVRRQMSADVPLGAFLSGGIDSSIVVGLMTRSSNRPVKTYSVGFDWQAGAGYDETPFAQATATHFGSEHHEITLRPDASSLWAQLTAHFDEPFADPASIPTYLISRYARESVTVVLTGEGADELFAGYGWYTWARRRVPIPFASHLAARALDGRRGKRSAMALFAPDLETMYFENALCSVFQSAERQRLFTSDFRRSLGTHSLAEDFRKALAASTDADPQSRMQDLDMRIWLEGDPLTKVDRMSMAASLEARVPFLDYRMVELAMAMPSGLKLRDGTSKAILRETFSDLLPVEVLRRQKHAFVVPVSAWLRGILRPQVESLAGHPSISESGFFEPDYVQRLAQAHLAGRDYGAQIWALLTWSLWWDSR